MRIVLKTTVASESEIPWLLVKFREAREHADLFIVSEFDYTLSGLKKPFTFEPFVNEFEREFDGFHYLQGRSVEGVVPNAKSTQEHRHNETIFRGWFARQLPLKNSDIIVSTDADEVLYESSYSWIKRNFRRFDRGYRFRLHQVFYRPNYLWLDKEFVAPVALRFGAYNKVFPNNWRNQGPKLPGFWGVHFSWCMPVDDMLTKVKSYGHAPEHKHLSDREIFEHAIREKIFPFDDRDFRLQPIAFDSPILPASLASVKDRVSPEVWSTPEGL